MLVPDLPFLKVLLVRRLVDFLEDVLEASIVLLEDGVLGAHVQRQALGDGKLEAGVREALDALVRVVLRLRHAAAVLESEDLDFLRRAALGREDHRERAIAGNHTVLCAVLVAEGVTADDDGFLPARHEPGNARDDDRFSEDGAAECVANGSVGGEPHCCGLWSAMRHAPTGIPASNINHTLLKLELLDSRLVGRDRGTLDSDRIPLDGLRRIDRDLVVGLVSVLQPQVVVLQLDVQVGEDEPVLDVLPDDARHLVAVQLDHRVLDLDLVEGGHVAGVDERAPEPCRREGKDLGGKSLWCELVAQSASEGSSGVHHRVCGREEGKYRSRSWRGRAARFFRPKYLS